MTKYNEKEHYLTVPSDIMAEVIREIVSIPTERIPDGSGQYSGPGSSNAWVNGTFNTRLYGEGWPDMLGWLELSHDSTRSICDAVNGLFLTLMQAIPTHKCERGFNEKDYNILLRQVMVNHIEPGASLLKHRDGPPADMRFHLPVITHESVEWWDEINDYSYHMPNGVWCGPVNYSGILHSVSNQSSFVRTHIIADFYRE